MPDKKPNLSHIEIGEHTKEQWNEIWRVIKSGQEAVVNRSIFYNFLEVLPPKWMDPVTRRRFVHSDGPTYPALFVYHGGSHYTMQGFADYPSLREHTGIDAHYLG